MEKRRFGKTGFDVSVIGFGGAPIGFLETTIDQVTRLLQELLDQGVNLVDTAAMYQGSEEAIGRALGRRRNDVFLVTKCGSGGGAGSDMDCWSWDEVTQAVDRALTRLETDHLDAMLLHSCDLETLQRGEALEALVLARQTGKVRFIGYSGDNEAALYAAAHPEISIIETSVNLCDQWAITHLLPKARENDLAVIAKRPLANSAWKSLDKQPGLYAQYAREYTERLAKMRITPEDLGFAGDANELWPEIALRFTLSQPGVHTAIIGTTSIEHARQNIAAAAKGPLPEDVVARIHGAFGQGEAASETLWSGQV